MSIYSVLIALVASLVFALAAHVQNRAVKDIDPIRGSFISICTMSVMFWLVAPFVINFDWFLTRSALIFAACGLLFPAMSQLMQIASIQRVGPSLTSAISSFWLIFAIAPAIVFLGEPFTGQMGVGLGLMLTGLVLAPFARGGRFKVAYVIALLFPLGAAIARGLSQPISKFGYSELNQPFFATLVMATVSSVIAAIYVQLSGRGFPRVNRTKGIQWFVLNGVLIGLGILLTQSALALGNVAPVTAVISLSPIWTLTMGVLIFRTETLRAVQFVLVGLIVLGTILMVAR